MSINFSLYLKDKEEEAIHLTNMPCLSPYQRNMKPYNRMVFYFHKGEPTYPYEGRPCSPFSISELREYAKYLRRAGLFIRFYTRRNNDIGMIPTPMSFDIDFRGTLRGKIAFHCARFCVELPNPPIVTRFLDLGRQESDVSYWARLMMSLFEGSYCGSNHSFGPWRFPKLLSDIEAREFLKTKIPMGEYNSWIKGKVERPESGLIPVAGPLSIRKDDFSMVNLGQEFSQFMGKESNVNILYQKYQELAHA